MRILVDARPITDRTQGGVGRVSRLITEAYATAYPEDELVLVTTGSERPTLPGALGSKPNVRHLHHRIPNKIWSTLCCAGIASLVRESERLAGRCDVAFFPNIGFIGSTRSRPSSLLLHDLSFLIEPRWFTRRQRWWHRAVHAARLIRSASHLLAVSETTKRDAMRILGIPPERISVIPVGPTLPPVPLLAKEGQGEIAPRYALAIGWNDRRKNAMMAVEAVRLLRKETGFSDLTIAIVGYPKNVILSGAKNLPIHSGVIGIERPSDAELASLYANAAVFLYPSWYEGYGLPLHEAAVYGTPRVASTAGALPETAPPGTFFANPAKPHHWAEAIRLALTASRTPVRPAASWNEAAARLRAAFEGMAR